jgi:hypothetical protein
MASYPYRACTRSAFLMAVSVLLHWLLAESFFFVHREVFDVEGNLGPSDAIDVIGCSIAGLSLFLCFDYR